MKKNYQYNVLGLAETLLENNKNKLEKVVQMVIQEIDKNDVLIGDHMFDRDELPNKLLEVFDKGVSNLKSIKIYYIEHGLRQFLTDIEIF